MREESDMPDARVAKIEDEPGRIAADVAAALTANVAAPPSL
jgi:hypothetical protein